MRAAVSVDRRTRTRGDKARMKVQRMIKEITEWKGERPTVVRLNAGDCLALVECGYVVDGKLSGDPHGLEVKPG